MTVRRLVAGLGVVGQAEDGLAVVGQEDEGILLGDIAGYSEGTTRSRHWNEETGKHNHL